MHNKRDRTCYLCMRLHRDYSEKVTQEHHIMCGTANRRMSEKYGLKVYLCIYHHTEGKESVHHNKQRMLELKREAQIAFEKTYPELVFREVFGKNYLVEEVREPEPAADAGFIVTGNILTDANWLNQV